MGESDKQYKVSFCTKCKGRLPHLKKTLPVNIANNSDYPDMEFVILDYDSPDGLEQWVKETYPDEIRDGRIRYARFEPAPAFKMAHAKNMAHRLARGDILCNLDADNIVGPGYASWLNKTFHEDPNIYVRPDRRTQLIKGVFDSTQRLAFGAVRSVGLGRKQQLPQRVELHNPFLMGAAGRITIMRKHFEALRGYDEIYDHWSGEDGDLAHRAQYAGLNHVKIPPALLGEVIAHDDASRMQWLAPQHIAAVSEALKERHTLAGIYRRVTNSYRTPGGPEKPPVPPNSEGNVGCGRVRINFADHATEIEPIAPSAGTDPVIIAPRPPARSR